MKIVVLDSATLGDDLDLSPLSEFGDTIIYQSSSADEVSERIKDADVIILNKVKITNEIMKSASKLKLVCIAATGYDNVDISSAKKHNIAVCNVCGYSTNSVAQVTLSLALNLYTKIFEYSSYVKNGNYSRGNTANCLTPVYHEIAEKTWGIIGLGNIGKQVARCADALGCNILAYRRKTDEKYKTVTLEELIRKSDIISVHLPLTDETKEIISQNLISQMKTNAILINMARGAVIDEKAIAFAVLQNKIAGFASDVYSEEPFSESHPYYALKDLQNVILTPHMAWGAYEARIRCLNEIIKNIKAFFNGENRSRLDI